MSKLWSRPPVAAAIMKEQSVNIAFQMVDVDYIQEDRGVRIRVFGTTKEGHSICCSAGLYVPYFFMSAPKSHKSTNLSLYKNALNESLKKLAPGQLRQYGPVGIDEYVLSVEEVRGKNLMTYKEEELLLKINVISPKMLTACRNAFCEAVKENLTCFEANIDFEIRFMADLKMVGCCWMEVPANKYHVIPAYKKDTNCQIEITMKINDLIVHSPNTDPWGDIAPIRTMSFDIEVDGRPGVFPEAKQDPIIMIACVCKAEGASEPFVRTCFVVKGCNPVKGAEIICCKSEEELLKRFASYVREVDPDIVTGYNVQNFDIPYVLDRARILKIDEDVAAISRIKGALCKVRDATLSSSQMGTRTNKITSMDGRIVFDVFQVVTREYKLRSYTLNNVSYHFLGDQKEDVAHQMISILHNGTDQDRRRLAVYCLKDADLPVRLLEKLMLMINYIEMARVTGVPLNFLIERGQQVKILSQLLRKARVTGYYLPVIEKGGGDDESYEGATVLEPETGFYNQPIATLDFASLYPSIMIAHNLCYTTVLPKPIPDDFKKDVDYVVTPSNNLFVTKTKRRGLLPLILEDLLSARKKAKKDLKEATDPLKKMVLNGRQLALKISANSVYGFTGATRGKLPCLEISQSVTSYGRTMIEMTKNAVEQTYKKGYEGAPADARVIYGDTDSVMVEFGVQDIAEAMRLGQHAAEHISKIFPPPIKLEFEKVYCPYLLMNKKRYAGLYFTRPEKYDKLDCKGLETVRRDNCQLVGKVMGTCLKLLLENRDPKAALDYAKRVISDLLCNKIDIGLLIVTKELTKTGEKSTNKLAHVVLAERMRQRDPGSAPKLGDRVPYVLVNKGKNVPAFEKAEDPRFVLQNSIPIDAQYYLEHQLLNPLTRIFDPLTNNKAKDILTKGDHARVKAQPASKNNSMAMFVKKVVTCLSCRSVIQDQKSASPLCKHCQPKVGLIYAEKMNSLREAEHKYARLWTECQNCAQDFTNEVLCVSSDCPIFWLREKARAELQERSAIIARFNK